MPHIPVLLHEVIKYLNPKPGEFLIDGTIDGGGHSAEILKMILPNGTLLGIDLDKNFIKHASQSISDNIGIQESSIKGNLIVVSGNFADIPVIVSKKKLPNADGLLLDLGFSSKQLAASGRGFSFAHDEPLLMTYDAEHKPVREFLKELSERDLAKMIFELSGERYARRIARAIKKREQEKPIETTGELRELVRSAVPGGYERGRIDPATRTFQALRMHANDELGNLEKILAALPRILRRNGRVVIVSFHSLEDRLVKIYFKKFEAEGIMKILTAKPVRPSAIEIQNNPRSRSARLRAAQIR